MHIQANAKIGDYKLLEQIYESPTTSAWKARQLSVNRNVVIEILRPEVSNENTIKSFLGDVRSKAAVNIPHISSVYEAAEFQGLWYFTRELPRGHSLAALIEHNISLTPQELAKCLRSVAETMRKVESAGLATMPLSLHDIYRDDKGITRMVNLVVAGAGDEQAQRRDVATLGRELPQLVQIGAPGTNRFYTLCSWMADDTRPDPLGWYDVQDYCETIQSQLTRIFDPSATNPQPAAPPQPSLWQRLKPYRNILFTSVAVVACVGAVVYSALNNKQPSSPASPPVQQPEPRKDHTYVNFVPGKTLGLNAQHLEYPGFAASTHEVTIEAYAKFLAALAQNPELFKKLSDPAQSPTQTNFIPKDWNEQYAAAKNGTLYNKQKISLRHPVVNVNYWDALAYAKWQDAQLPSYEQWSVLAELNDPNKRADGYLSVDEHQRDVTGRGISGVCGRVSEWSQTRAIDPMHPMDGNKYLILGGHGNTGLANEKKYVPQATHRDANLGFRIVKTKK